MDFPLQRSCLIPLGSKMALSRFSWKETYPHQPTPLFLPEFRAHKCGHGGVHRLPPDSPLFPTPHLSAAPRGVLLPPAAPKPEPSPAQRWGPASSACARAVAGQGPGHGVPPTPLRAPRPALSAGETLGVGLPSRQRCRAAGQRHPRRNPAAAAAPGLAASPQLR